MNTREKGNIGEDIACDYLIKRGYSVINRNYLKKWGEIDIVAIKDDILNFFEVKSVIDNNSNIGYRPEDNVHEFKLRKLRRVIQTYLNEYKLINSLSEVEFKFHVITVKIDLINNKNVINILEDLIL